MTDGPTKPSIAGRLYRLALHLLPRELRESHGAEMGRLFDELLRDARADGGWMRASGYFAESMWKLVACALQARRDREVMGRSPTPEAGGHTMGVGEMIGTVWQDVRIGARALLKRPGFALTAVGILAAGIGATTTIFSVVDTVVLRALPYPDAGELVHFDNGSHSYVSLRAWEELESFASISAARDFQVDLTGEGAPERLPAAAVSPDFFRMFGGAPHMGRLFVPEDYPGDRTVAVVSHGLYQRLGSDPGLLERGLNLGGSATQIVGVLAPGFLPPELETGSRVDVWYPLDDGGESANHHGFHVLGIVGRLTPGVALEAAQAEIDAQREATAAEVPNHYINRDGSMDMVPLVPIHEATVRDVRSTLYLLLGAVGMMLLIACANVANLFMARGTARTREIALRGALGASRARIAGQVLTESVLLALAGGALGVVVAYVGIDAYSRFAPGDLPRIDLLAVDTRVLLFSVVVSVGTGILFGTLPALQAIRANMSDALKEGAAATTTSLGGRRVRSGLVVSEIALAMVLLVGAGLLLRSFVAMVQVDPGFAVEGLVVMPLSLDVGYDNEERGLFATELTERIEAMPGTRSVTMGWTLPFTYTGRSRCCWRTSVTGDPALVNEDRPFLSIIHPVTAGYFGTLDAPVIHGRDMAPSDGVGQDVAVLNRPAAEALFGEANAVGRTVSVGDETLQVVGVVEGVNHWGLSQPVEQALYVPYGNYGFEFPRLQTLVRTDAPLEVVAEALRSAVWEIDPTLPIDGIETMKQRVSGSLATPRFLSGLLTAFAVIALLLACGGIYGSMLYTVGQRRKEMGIRLALGAGGGDVIRLILRYGFVLTVVGLAAGALASWRMSRFMEELVWGVGTTDVLTFVGTAVLLGTTAIAASFMPAWRASRTDPLETLRAE